MINPKQPGVAPVVGETPSQTTQTCIENHGDVPVCQVPAQVSDVTPIREQSGVLTLSSNQIPDVYAPGAIVGGSARSLPPSGIKTSPTENVKVRTPITNRSRLRLSTTGSIRQIASEGDIAIYEQRWIRPRGELSENVAYEVVRIQLHEAHTFPGGESYPAREGYPTSESWGTHGFTLTDRDAAFNKFRQMSLAGPAKTNLEQAGDGLGQEPNTNRNSN